MATTLNNSGVVFPDNTTQTTAVPLGYKQIFSGVLSANNWKHSGSFATTDLNPIYQIGWWWTVKYGSGLNTREWHSADSFLIMTQVNDYYNNSSNPSGRGWSMITDYKAVTLGSSTAETRLSYMLERLDFYPYPNQINCQIYVPTTSSLTSAVYGGQITNDTAHLPPISGPSKWARPF